MPLTFPRVLTGTATVAATDTVTDMGMVTDMGTVTGILMKIKIIGSQPSLN